jgi:protein-serine/threonine kinase
MLAGYLPFDDDPANPEGDNINLLYKYIVSTPLTFPEYVTPHARDLLRRILVPDPRKRADLFEVARHSWLSEFSHVVSHITSSTTNISDIATTTVPAGMFGSVSQKIEQGRILTCGLLEGTQEGPSLARSASVREPQKSFQTSASTLGGLTHQQGKVAQDESAEKTKTSREQKRRTVQVEYVAPQSQTTRGESSSRSAANSAADVSTSTPRAAVPAGPRAPPDQNKPLPSEPRGAASRTDYSSSSQDNRPDAPRSTSETTGAMYNTRPNTGHSMASLNAGRLPSRGSYGQPVAPTVAATNAQGRLAQPKNGKQYNISAPIPQDADISIGRPSTHQLPAKYSPNPPADIPRGHKRSSTVSSIGEKIFGRSGSLFGNRSSQGPSRAKPSKRYPPTSMKEPYAGDDSRASIDSRQSNSHMSRSEGRPRRFSLINSLKGLSSSGRSEQHSETDSQEHNFSRPATGPSGPIGRENTYEAYVSTRASERPTETDYSSHIDRQFAELQEYQADVHAGGPKEHANNDFYGYPNHNNGGYDSRSRPSMQISRPKQGVLQKSNRKFADAYEYERDPSHHSGSSGAARKVMDFFRRRGKARAGE